MAKNEERVVGITFYTPPPEPADEHARARAVEVSGALKAMDDPELARLVERARKTMGTSMAAVSIVHEEWQYLVAAAGVSTGVYGRRTSFCGHTLTTPDDIFCVLDANVDPRFAGNPAVTDGTVRFYIGMPICDEHGQPLGALCAFDPAPRNALDRRQEQQFRDLARAILARFAELRETVFAY